MKTWLILYYCFNSFCLAVISFIFQNVQLLILGLFLTTSMQIFFLRFNTALLRLATVTLVGGQIIMCVIYFGYMHQYGAPYYVGGSDDILYELGAIKAYENGIWTLEEAKTYLWRGFSNSSGYIWFETLIMRISYAFGGFHPIIFRIINVHLWTAVATLCYRYMIGNENMNCRHALWVSLFIYFFPNAIFVVTHNFRDTQTVFIVFLVFYLLSNISKYEWFEKVIVIIITLIATYYAYYLREIVVIYVAFIAIVALIIKVEVSASKLVILLVSIAIVAYVIGAFDTMIEYQEFYNKLLTELKGTAYHNIFTTPLLPWGIWQRIGVALIYPGANDVLKIFYGVSTFKDLVDIWISLGSLIQLLLLPYVFINIKKIDKLVIVGAMIFLSIALTTIGFRHFLFVYPFLFIAAFRIYVKASTRIKIKCLVLSFLIGLTEILIFL